MITAIACACGNSEKLVRSRLKAAGVKDYMNVPLAIGRAASLSSISKLPQYRDVAVLPEYVRNHSSYAVIIGYDDIDGSWVDITKDGNYGQMKLQVLIKDYLK